MIVRFPDSLGISRVFRKGVPQGPGVQPIDEGRTYPAVEDLNCAGGKPVVLCGPGIGQIITEALDDVNKAPGEIFVPARMLLPRMPQVCPQSRQRYTVRIRISGLPQEGQTRHFLSIPACTRYFSDSVSPISVPTNIFITDITRDRQDV
jgi:hypothetical protein